MKTAKKMTLLMGLIFFSIAAATGIPQGEDSSLKGTLQVVCSPELENLSLQLADDFMKQYGATEIEVKSAGNDKIPGSLGEGKIALVTKESLSENGLGSCFSMVVGRDAIVPIMNAENPQIERILESGISPYDFSLIYTGQGPRTWGELFGTENKQVIHAFLPAGPGSIRYLAAFIKSEPRGLKGEAHLGDEELWNLVQEDPGAIGFCSLAFLTEKENSGVDLGVRLVPVDANGDGRIEAFEDIYRSGTLLSHAVYVGRFPGSLYSRIYALTGAQPADDLERTFMEWLVSGGQETLASAGILALGRGERNSRLAQLSGFVQPVAHVPIQNSALRVLLVVGIFILLAAVLVTFLAWILGRRNLSEEAGSVGEEVPAGVPGGLFFDRSHTWAYMEKNGRVRIGIDHFLQELTGPVTRIIMKQPGERIKRNEYFLTLIQNGKRLQIKSPITGIIKEQNEEVLKKASLLNREPYESGWLLMVEPLSWITELKFYFLGSRYADWLKKEGVRVKEFFASLLKPEDANQQSLVLQDGGEIKPGVLEQLGPEVWEEFQEGYLNRTN